MIYGGQLPLKIIFLAEYKATPKNMFAYPSQMADENLYMKVVSLEETYTFVFHIFLVWDHLGCQTLFEAQTFWNSKLLEKMIFISKL